MLTIQHGHYRPDAVTRSSIIEPYDLRTNDPVTVARHTIDPFIFGIRPAGAMIDSRTPANGALGNFRGPGRLPNFIARWLRHRRGLGNGYPRLLGNGNGNGGPQLGPYGQDFGSKVYAAAQGIPGSFMQQRFMQQGTNTEVSVTTRPPMPGAQPTPMPPYGYGVPVPGAHGPLATLYRATYASVAHPYRDSFWGRVFGVQKQQMRYVSAAAQDATNVYRQR